MIGSAAIVRPTETKPGRELKQTMAHLWQLDGPMWQRLPLAGRYFGLGAPPERRAQPATSLPFGEATAVIGCYEFPGQAARWILFEKSPSSVRLNGNPILAGIAVLKDRDEILLHGLTRLYFSTEEEARVETFPGGESPVFCARCRQAIPPGTPAVRCPACGHWCEQSELKPCWTYGPTCPLCEQATAFDAGLRWTPEEL